MSWLESPDGVLTFARGEGFVCVVNLSDAPVELPAHASVLLASEAISDALLPPDSAAWLTTDERAD